MTDAAAEPVVTMSVDDNGVATILLNRPPMNALDFEVQTTLGALSTEAASRKDVRAVVIYGGEKLFAAGADIKEMQGMGYEDMSRAIMALQARLGATAAIPQPTIAAITGFALGGGLEIALSCDFRICGESARLGVPEIGLGLIPGGGGTQRLPRLIGPARAKDLVFSGRFVRADEALAIGLVDAVVPDGDVYTAAVARATKLAAGPATALRAAKQAIDRGLEVDLATGLTIEGALFAGLFATEDMKIGTTSFVAQGPGKAVFTR